MKFSIEIEAEVADHDADVMLQVPDAINDRFSGTAVRIGTITTTKESG